MSNTTRLTITLCGSTKFKSEFERINSELTLAGHVVFSVACFSHTDSIVLSPTQKQLLNDVHKRKISKSDAIVIINVDDYIGDGLREEMDYARANNVDIYYYWPTNDTNAKYTVDFH